ncbi:prealbumin-like fold domain-containing protein [Deinococcus radiotolerans]|uniref:Ig-like domain-containing protein n=1 Tax=Deinococcus radiotolerans TaxID=1309407 RepID=A0ABQ2FN19_9DEIO|nr:hypothetical protein [Deinococcus radiotolerans]GGL10079.1 hypothetical protein GCM10010844_30970 [Deinococcus radiotolerans]
MNPWPRRLPVETLLALSVLVACNQNAGRPTQPAMPTPVVTRSPGLHAQAFTTPYPTSDSVSFTLEGCRNDGTPPITLPNGSGKFICPDAAYTTGNLGKGWNELDLVPHRLTLSVGNQKSATTQFLVVLAADYQSDGAFGYDVLSVPEVNAAKSDVSCQISVDTQKDQTGITGGTDRTAYRLVNVDLNRGATCVLDYYQRLALGAASYPGSSLQAYMFADAAFKTGKRTIPLPVREILPQSLSKTMVASQGRDQVWDLTKGATPATLNFGDVCANTFTPAQPVKINVTWEIKSVQPGDVTLITKVYATNPAARTITVQVTDRMYRGSDQSTLLDTTQGQAVDVPANTANYLVLTHTFPYTTSSDLLGTTFNDVATATYTDKVTGVTVPGDTTAAASAQVTAGATTNASASVTDDEIITGNGLTFSVTQPTLGTFTNYAAGTATTGPVSWQVTGQTTGGTVQFDKTVLLDTRRVTTGLLSDEAHLNGSDGAAAQASAAVNISSSASVTLTITKTIPDVLQNAEQQQFSFTVKDSAGQVVATPSVTFTAGQTSQSVSVTTNPGVYTVTENPATGWTSQPAQHVDLQLPTCAGGVTFNNEVTPATARVQKITLPAGQESGWTFTLNRVNGQLSPLETGVTASGGQLNFTTPLTEGAYQITETAQPGFKQTANSGCTFTVNYPADAGRTYTCSATNTQLPRLTVVKYVVNEYGGTKVVSDFPLNVSGTAVTSGQVNTFDPGTYTVGEGSLPYGYTQDAISGDCTATGSVILNPGDNKSCTITNSDSPATLVIVKNAKPATGSFSFLTTGSGYSGFTLSPAGWTNTQGNLSAGTYTIREQTQLGWVLTGLGGSPDPSTPYACVTTGQGGSVGTGNLDTQTATITLKMGDTVTCTFENTGQGVTRTQGFWATHPQLAMIAWTGGQGFGHAFPGVSAVSGIGDAALCSRTIAAGSLAATGSSGLMGAFWSDVSKTTTGAKRSALDQARMQLLQQLVAAELNASAFGSVPASGSFSTWEAAYCGTNTQAIKTAQQQAASFNTAGDSGAFTPGTSADSKAARAMANRDFWNTLP